MKKIFLLVFISSYCTSLLAQKDDSLVLANAVLHYSVQGNGQPILLLSGGPGVSANQLFELSERLSQNYRCILFEQRGTGKSHTSPMDSTTINLDQSFKDIDLLLQRQSIERITIVGHSWGATLGLSYAITHPDRVSKLVLIGVGPLELPDYRIVAHNLMSRTTDEEKAFMNQADDSIGNRTASTETARKYRRIFIRCFLSDTSKVDSVISIIKKSSQNNIMHALMMQDLARIKYNIKPDIPKVTVALLAICGRQDPVGVFSTNTVKELNKKARVAWIENSGHFPWLEQPEPFYSQLLNFLK